MSSIRIVRRRRRSRRRGFKSFRARVVERLILRDDPNNVNRIIVQHEYALKRMYKASVPVPRAAAMVRRHCFDKHGVHENPVATGLPRGALILGSAALIAVGVTMLAAGLSAYAKKQDASPIPLHSDPINVWT